MQNQKNESSSNNEDEVGINHHHPSSYTNSSPDDSPASGHNTQPQSLDWQFSTDSKSADNSNEGTLTWGALLRETLQVVIPALTLAVVIHVFLAQATVVYGSSMQPVLRERQRLVVDKITYRFREPQRNDIIVLDLKNVDEMLVKRVIGLPGETVDIRAGNIYINNEPLREQLPHALSSHLNVYPHPIELAGNQYYVLGDNRSNSNDSRSFGAVQRDEIVGKIWLRYWPLTDLKLF